MTDISDDERRVLEGFAAGILGGPSERCHLVEELQPALASLKRRGLIHQEWVLSEAGEKALDGEHS